MSCRSVRTSLLPNSLFSDQSWRGSLISALFFSWWSTTVTLSSIGTVLPPSHTWAWHGVNFLMGVAGMWPYLWPGGDVVVEVSSWAQRDKIAPLLWSSEGPQGAITFWGLSISEHRDSRVDARAGHELPGHGSWTCTSYGPHFCVTRRVIITIGLSEDSEVKAFGPLSGFRGLSLGCSFG